MEGRILLIFFLFVGATVAWALWESGHLYVIVAKVLLCLLVIVGAITTLGIKLWLMVTIKRRWE